MKSALITGITGQDGSFLAEYLLAKNYKVHGFARRDSWYNSENVRHFSDDISITFGDITESGDIAPFVDKIKPTEIYHLASQSRPGESWARAAETLQINGMATLRLLEAVRQFSPSSRFYHASSSEIFGNADISPQDETTPLNPVNPYAASKVYAHQMTKIYRESHSLYAVNGILFNHESERRPLHFLTQKVCYGAACAGLGITDSPDLNERGKPIVSGGKLSLGNLNAARDWGYAGDYVKAMWMMLQQEVPQDFVIGTGSMHSIKDVCNIAYSSVDQPWAEHVEVDEALVRPREKGESRANISRAQVELGWKSDVSLNEMISLMVKAQMARLDSQ